MIIRSVKNIRKCLSSLPVLSPIASPIIITNKLRINSLFSSSTIIPHPSSSASSAAASSSASASSSTASATSTDNENYDSSKDETLCQYSGLPALNQYIDDSKNDIFIIDSDDNLQGHWKSLESRVQKRRTRQRGSGGPEGRSTVRVTGWDAENV